MMHGVIQDFHFALRQLLKNRAFIIIAVLTLALGIGANTAIFSVVNGVLLRPLPFQDPARLMRIWHVPPAKSFPGMNQFAVSPANYLDWQKQNDVFESTAIYGYRSFTLTGTQNPEQVQASGVSSTFFHTLGVQPMLGRVFSPEEDQPGHANVVVLSYGFWQQHYGNNRSIVSQNITLDGQNYLVAGVMPRGFNFPDFAQAWTPLAWTDKDRAVRGNHNYMVVGRLKPGVELQQAQAEMNTISRRLEQLFPEDDKGWGAVVLPLHDDLVGDVRPALLVLLGAVGFVLLIACVNVANLGLAKTFSRRKEIAIRTALGASAGRVIKQVLAETILLSLLGGALGLALAPLGRNFIATLLANSLPAQVNTAVDLKVLSFTIIVSLLSGVLAGVLPAVRFSQMDVNHALKEGLGRTDSDSSGHRTRSILVVGEVALSLMLLFGAGLMIRSFQRLQNVSPGFDSHGVLTMTVAVARAKFQTPQQEISFFERVLQRVRALPGVQSVGVIDDLPLSPGGGSHQPIAIEGRPALAMADQPEVDVRVVSAGYMQSLQIPVLRGRDVSETDVTGRPGAVVISESMAREFWPGEDPIGKHLTMTFFPGTSREVVGVVGNVKFDGLDQKRPTATLYTPLGQLSGATPGGWTSFPLTLVVRSSNPAALTAAVSNAIHEVDSGIPLRDVFTMDDVVRSSVSQPRLNMLLLGAFGGIALLLATVGIYSVLAYNVRRQIQEIGIRMALGAGTREVLRMVVLQGMKPTMAGVAIGIVGALALGRLVSSLIFGVKTTDPLTFVAAAAVLSIVALLACMLPAYRASKVDPMVALRYE